ncbi:MAG TPA: TlpA family protein disulfide reductase [Candidatus Aminicenantes bacterium]|nr:TlpA family protein disulfide reductase [Candidatus Aminicenantes bacterium]
MKTRISLLVLAVVLFLAVVPAKPVMSRDNGFPDAPDFFLKDLNGNEVTLDDFKGKVLFVNFWATWCPPCREEIPGFVETYAVYHEKGMEILGISLDRQGVYVVKKFAEKYEVNYPIALGTQQLVQDYQPGQYIPTTIIIDREGKIRHRHVGYMDKTVLEKYFLELSQ